MAVASGVADITKHLLEIRVDVDHKNKIGKGVLQLAKDVGGPSLNCYKFLKHSAKDKNGDKLIETFIAPSRKPEDRCMGISSTRLSYVEPDRVERRFANGDTQRQGQGRRDVLQL